MAINYPLHIPLASNVCVPVVDMEVLFLYSVVLLWLPRYTKLVKTSIFYDSWTLGKARSNTVPDPVNKVDRIC